MTSLQPNPKLLALLLFGMMQSAVASQELEEEERWLQYVKEEVEPSTAVLFPWFAEALGIVVFFITTRYLTALPFTAIMFLLGVFIGCGAARLQNEDQLTQSILQWIGINSEVLLLVFLPGLVFDDSFGLNVFLFKKAFWQIIILAFPMVLAGTCLTALVGFYILPYSWSWNLSMTFGSILAATDPVAVCSLMDEVGAPPRLKMLISGESMLNDGSSFVFYVIFSALFLTELGIPGLGGEVTVGEGFAQFFQLALGGAAVGIAFGLGLVFILYTLNRRLDSQENVLQVVATITMAYLAYYVADRVCSTSGVISTVMCGVTAKAFGNSMINDQEMMESFWSLVDQLLNTLLFTLAGLVWGSIIVSDDGWKAKDWGYLILFYILLNVIRGICVAGFYPILAKIGLGCGVKDAIFMSWGGLRGGVAIALSISLDSTVQEAAVASSQDISIYQTQTAQLFSMVGGVACLTLVINGTLAGPLLTKLGLTRSSKVRVELVDEFKRTAKAVIIDKFVRMLSNPLFRYVDFAVVREHVSALKDLSLDELKASVMRNKDVSPYLDNIVPYLSKDGEDSDLSWAKHVPNKTESVTGVARDSADLVIPSDNDKTSMNTIELRQFFIEVLSSVYTKQVERGEMDGRDEFVTFVLTQSLEFEKENVSKGKPLQDWETAEQLSEVPSKARSKVLSWDHYLSKKLGNAETYTIDYRSVHDQVYRAMAFIQCHKDAEKHVREMFQNADDAFQESERIVLSESETQVNLAKETLAKTDKETLDMLVSHCFCSILLNKAARYIEKLSGEGVLQGREVGEYLQKLDKAIQYSEHCGQHDHPGELAKTTEEPVDDKETEEGALSSEGDVDHGGQPENPGRSERIGGKSDLDVSMTA